MNDINTTGYYHQTSVPITLEPTEITTADIQQVNDILYPEEIRQADIIKKLVPPSQAPDQSPKTTNIKPLPQRR